MQKIPFFVIDGDVETLLPRRSTKFSAGYDLMSSEDVKVPAGGKVIIKTGVIPYMDELCGYYFQLQPRSGISLKGDNNTTIHTGVIDADYHSEIMIGFRNMQDIDVLIKRGDRIAQGIFQPYLILDPIAVKSEEEGLNFHNCNSNIENKIINIGNSSNDASPILINGNVEVDGSIRILPTREGGFGSTGK